MEWTNTCRVSKDIFNTSIVQKIYVCRTCVSASNYYYKNDIRGNSKMSLRCGHKIRPPPLIIGFNGDVHFLFSEADVLQCLRPKISEPKLPNSTQ